MTSFKNMMRVAALSVAVFAAAAAPTKQANAADRGDVVAGVVGGVLLGGLLATVANANSASNIGPVQTYEAPVQTYVAPQQTYHAPVQTYHDPIQTEVYYEAPEPTYYAPVPQYYAPPVSFSFGISSGHRFGNRRHFSRHNSRSFQRRHHRGDRYYGR